jgi:hypothetical protein
MQELRDKAGEQRHGTTQAKRVDATVIASSHRPSADPP